MNGRRIEPHPHGQGGERWAIVGGDVPWTNGVGFRDRDVAERALVATLAELFTLYSSERRLHADPLESNEGCIAWKLESGLPLTEREQSYVDERVAELRARREERRRNRL